MFSQAMHNYINRLKKDKAIKPTKESGSFVPRPPHKLGDQCTEKHNRGGKRMSESKGSKKFQTNFAKYAPVHSWVARISA